MEGRTSSDSPQVIVSRAATVCLARVERPGTQGAWELFDADSFEECWDVRRILYVPAGTIGHSAALSPGLGAARDQGRQRGRQGRPRLRLFDGLAVGRLLAAHALPVNDLAELDKLGKLTKRNDGSLEVEIPSQQDLFAPVLPDRGFHPHVHGLTWSGAFSAPCRRRAIVIERS